MLKPLLPIMHPFKSVDMGLLTAFLIALHCHYAVFTVVDWFSKLVTLVPCVTIYIAGDIA